MTTATTAAASEAALRMTTVTMAVMAEPHSQ
jgi:hypothetical protein